MVPIKDIVYTACFILQFTSASLITYSFHFLQTNIVAYLTVVQACVRMADIANFLIIYLNCTTDHKSCWLLCIYHSISMNSSR